MSESSPFSPFRMRSRAGLAALLTLTALAAFGCASQSIQIIKDDSGGVVVASSLICPGSKYQLIINQDPSRNRVLDVEAQDNRIRFGGSELDIFDFTQPVTITLIVREAGEDCPGTAALVNQAFEARNVRPRPVAGENRTFEVSSSQFRPVPKPQPQ